MGLTATPDAASIAQQIGASLAETRTALVQVRQVIERVRAEAFESVDEEGWTNSGSSVTPNVMFPTPIKVTALVLYTSGAGSTTLLRRANDGFGVPIPQGLTVMRGLGYLMKAGDRPVLTDSVGGKVLYIGLAGTALPARVDPV